MTTMTTTQSTTNFSHFDTGNTGRTWSNVTEQAIAQGFVIADGERVLESWTGFRIIVVPTGGTRQFWGVTCDTFDRHEVVTTANEQGHVIGVKGAKVTGGRVAIRRW